MLVELFSSFIRHAHEIILLIFDYIFPEYPKIGLAVVITSLIFFVYYLIVGRAPAAFKMAGITLFTLCLLLYTVHIMIKLFHVAM